MTKLLITSLLFVSSGAFANEGLDRVVEQHRIDSEQRRIEFQKLIRESEERMKLLEKSIITNVDEVSYATETRASVRARINTLKSRLGIYGRY